MQQRSYRQHCGLAAALDVVGERWAMLIVRELAAGAQSFSELARSLPGISSALLTRRLREMEAAGVVDRDDEGRGRYRLSEQGRALGPALAALGVWGARRLPPASTDWAVAVPARDPLWTLQTLAAASSNRSRPSGRRASGVVNVEVDGQWYHLAHDGVIARRGAHPESHASVRIEHYALERVRAGVATIADVEAEGRAVVGGDRRAVRRAFVQPSQRTAT